MPEQIISPIPRPAADYFQIKETGGHAIVENLKGHAAIPLIDRIEYPDEGGTFIYHVGSLYPVKGFPFPEAVMGCNFIKRFFITNVRFFASTWLAALSLMGIGSLGRWLGMFNEISETVIRQYVPEYKRCTPLVQEMITFLRTFLRGIGIGPNTSRMFSINFSTLIEYDDAYRYIIQDMLSETTKDKLMAHPVREIKKIYSILQERDGRQKIQKHFGAIALILTMVLWIPKVRRSFKKALEAVNFERMQTDEADWYHTLRVDTYNFGGISYEDRRKEYVDRHTKAGIMPKFYNMTNVQVQE